MNQIKNHSIITPLTISVAVMMLFSLLFPLNYSALANHSKTELSLRSASQDECDWTDVWITVGAGSGNITMTQSGNKVHGEYPEPEKGGSLDGKIEGRYLTGRWRNPGTKTAGDFKFEMLSGCNSFRGAWNISSSNNPGIKPDEGARQGKLPRTWNGTRK